jgi:hypothetical protein
MPRAKKQSKAVKKNAELQQIIDAAQRLGVTIDKEKAIKWLEDMATAKKTSGDITIDEKTGVYGHEINMIDFDSNDLDRYKRIADIVGLPDTKGVVETAISLSGSAAQGKIQRYPGDLDYFERVNILAPTREAACKIIGEVMRKKALDKFYSPTYQLIEVKWGTFKSEFKKKGKAIKAGSPISWDAEEVKQGFMMLEDEKANPVKLDWSYGEKDPAWCKQDWLIAEPDKGRVVNVSNMLDVTWEAPDGKIIPLDGQLDPYFQEVYLEAGSIPLFTKLRQNLTPDHLEKYVKALEGQVIYYSKEGPQQNFGKVAKRLYNIFRLTGAHKEAMFIRELFDEPASALYQVWAIIDTLDDVGKPGSSIDKKTLLKQMSDLIKLVVDTCEGEAETKIVEAIMKLRDDVAGIADISDEEWSKTISETRFLVVKLVNEYFYTRLELIPQIIAYIEKIRKQ